MPPRYAYWTILAGGLPTAFRTTEREELLPTFKRIQEKHPDAEMKYFAKGKLWDSREAAYAPTDRGGSTRGRDWRPGGEHRDPRQTFKDAKKERNLDRRKARFERKHQPPREKPHGDPLRRDVRPDWRDKPAGPASASGRPGGPPKSRPAGPKGPPRQRSVENRDWRDRAPREKPHGDPLRRQARPFARKRFERNQGTEEPQPPQRPPGPNREPRPAEVPKPSPPPRPSEPAEPPSGPPERGRPSKSRFRKGPRFPTDRRRRS